MSTLIAAAWVFLCALFCGDLLRLDVAGRRIRRGRWSWWGATCLALALGAIATLPFGLTLQDLDAAFSRALS